MELIDRHASLDLSVKEKQPERNGKGKGGTEKRAKEVFMRPDPVID